MNSRNSWKIYNTIFFPLIFLFILTAAPLSSNNNNCGTCLVRDGRVFIRDMNTLRELSVPGYFHGAVIRGKTLYYLRGEDLRSPGLYAGFRDTEGSAAMDRKLPGVFEDCKIDKFDADAAAVFFLCSKAKHNGDAGGTLYRYSFDSRDILKHENVFDFHIREKAILLIQKRAGKYYLNNNADELPLSVKGMPRFSDVIKGGIAVVSGDNESEIVDTARMKSVYLYSEDRRYVLPEEYNLEIRAVDEGEIGQNMIFYKIDIDGSEKGRTNTALGQLPLVYHDRIEQNSYHIITLERWELNRARKQYMRVNNIHQPDSIKIYMPENRVLKLNVLFNGKNYTVRESFAVEE